MGDEPKFKSDGRAAIAVALSQAERAASGHGTDGHADRAAAHFGRLADEAAAGLTPAMLARVRERFGARACFETLAELGRDLDIPADGSGAHLVADAVEARLELARLHKDPDYVEKLLSGDPHTNDLERDLHVRGSPVELDPRARPRDPR